MLTLKVKNKAMETKRSASLKDSRSLLALLFLVVVCSMDHGEMARENKEYFSSPQLSGFVLFTKILFIPHPHPTPAPSHFAIVQWNRLLPRLAMLTYFESLYLLKQ